MALKVCLTDYKTERQFCLTVCITYHIVDYTTHLFKVKCLATG